MANEENKQPTSGVGIEDIEISIDPIIDEAALWEQTKLGIAAAFNESGQQRPDQPQLTLNQIVARWNGNSAETDEASQTTVTENKTAVTYPDKVDMVKEAHIGDLFPSWSHVYRKMSRLKGLDEKINYLDRKLADCEQAYERLQILIDEEMVTPTIYHDARLKVFRSLARKYERAENVLFRLIALQTFVNGIKAIFRGSASQKRELAPTEAKSSYSVQPERFRSKQLRRALIFLLIAADIGGAVLVTEVMSRVSEQDIDVLAARASELLISEMNYTPSLTPTATGTPTPYPRFESVAFNEASEADNLTIEPTASYVATPLPSTLEVEREARLQRSKMNQAEEAGETIVFSSDEETTGITVHPQFDIPEPELEPEQLVATEVPATPSGLQVHPQSSVTR